MPMRTWPVPGLDGGAGALGHRLGGSPGSLAPPKVAVPRGRGSKQEVRSRGKRRGSAATSGSSKFLEDERNSSLCPAGQRSGGPQLSVLERDWMFVWMRDCSSVGRSILEGALHFLLLGVSQPAYKK